MNQHDMVADAALTEFPVLCPDELSPVGMPTPKRRFRLESLTDAGLARLEQLLSDIGNNHAGVVDRRRIRLRQAQRELGEFVKRGLEG